MRKIIKGAEMTMQNALLLQQEIDQLQSENQYRRRRKARTRQFIQNGGSLMVSEAREQAQREQEQEQGECYRPSHIKSHMTMWKGKAEQLGNKEKEENRSTRYMQG